MRAAPTRPAQRAPQLRRAPSTPLPPRSASLPSSHLSFSVCADYIVWRCLTLFGRQAQPFSRLPMEFAVVDHVQLAHVAAREFEPALRLETRSSGTAAELVERRRASCIAILLPDPLDRLKLR